MPRTAQEILDHADELAARFETHQPGDDVHDATELRLVREAFLARADAERALGNAVVRARHKGTPGHRSGPWSAPRARQHASVTGSPSTPRSNNNVSEHPTRQSAGLAHLGHCSAGEYVREDAERGLPTVSLVGGIGEALLGSRPTVTCDPAQRAQQQLVLEFRIEAHRLDRGWSRPERRAPSLVAPCNEVVDVEAGLGLVGERFDLGIGEGSVRRHGSSSFRYLGRSADRVDDDLAPLVDQDDEFEQVARSIRAHGQAIGLRVLTDVLDRRVESPATACRLDVEIVDAVPASRRVDLHTRILYYIIQSAGDGRA